MYPPVRPQIPVPSPPPSSGSAYQASTYNPGYMAAATQKTGQSNGSKLTGDPKEDYPIVMAIDFGTTFTGCAFAFRKDPEIQEIITWYVLFFFFCHSSLPFLI